MIDVLGFSYSYLLAENGKYLNLFIFFSVLSPFFSPGSIALIFLFVGM